MLVSEMTAKELYGLIMLAFFAIFMVAFVWRNLPKSYDTPWGRGMKYTFTFGLIGLPAIFWGWPVFTAG